MDLNYKQFGSGFPLIILHGLMGSLDNWQSIAKKLAEKYTVYIIDQRNHGKSPHSNEFNYGLLANDLLEFMQQHEISKAHLIGHSMGGKVVMKFALQRPEMVAGLVVADTTPAEYDDRHGNVFDALFAADVEHATAREQVQQVLRSKLGGDETTVQFLMKSLHRDTSASAFTWRFNLQSLYNNYEKITEAITSAKPYTGPVLFIKGGKSDYISQATYPSIAELFPNHQLSEIAGAGHWVHAETPGVFINEVLKFLAPL